PLWLGGLPVERASPAKDGATPTASAEAATSKNLFMQPLYGGHWTDPPGLTKALRQAFVQPVDHLGHRLEPFRDRPQPEFPEMLGLDVERVRERADHVVGGHRAVSVDEVVEVARGETGLRRELAVGNADLVHERLDRRSERLHAEAPLA